MSPVEEDFRNALKQILRGLSEQSRTTGRSGGISILRVARTAKHSRTLISKKRCAYPKMRALILRVQRRVEACRNQKTQFSHDNSGEPNARDQSLVKTNARLRERVSELTAEVQMFATLLAEADQQLRIHRKSDDRAEHNRERKSKRDERRKSGY